MGQRNELRARRKYTGRAPRRSVALLSVSCALFVGSGWAAAATPEPAGGTLRDGQHDFDFNFGVWKTHIKRVLDPFSGSGASLELNGTVTVRKVWGGRALLEEIEADGPQGHWEGLTLFLYNPRAVLVRGMWSDIKPNSHRYEESYSADGGVTWVPAFIAELTREPTP